MDNNDAILTIENLHKYYQDVKAVDGLDLELKKGEIYGLLGPNGAGKSTTIKSILGLLALNDGSISVMGYDPTTDAIAVKSKIGYVAEEPALYESMTPRELFDFIASIRGLDADESKTRLERYMKSLDSLQYYDKIIATLSRGNKQKIQILAALLHNPTVLILDEPLSGLDARTAHVLKQIFQMHVEQGGSILLSTHIMEQAQTLCTRIGIIKKGTLVAEGSFEELQTMTQSDNDLEKIFLQLTDQDQEASEAVQNLRG